MNTFEIEAKALRETPAALLVETEYGEAWIPKSHINGNSDVYQQGDEGTLIVSAWIAEKKGWT
jgi:hypothetical protein